MGTTDVANAGAQPEGAPDLAERQRRERYAAIGRLRDRANGVEPAIDRQEWKAWRDEGRPSPRALPASG